MSATERYPPIASYGFLSDTHTAALVGPDGAVEWMCAPRFDGASVFAAILDRDRGGAFRLDAASGALTERSYLPGTLVLETRFRCPGGIAVAHDFLALTLPEHEESRLRPRHLLVRLLRCEEGEVEVDLRVDAQPDYGRAPAHWAQDEAGLTLDVPGTTLRLSTEPGARLDGGRPAVRTSLGRGERLAAALAYAADAPAPVDAEAAEGMLEETVASWRGWSSRCDYDGVAAEAVRHSAVVLRGLIFDESGALLAAPTASLPEELGGVRNWDYRFTWHRDAALTILALFRLGYDAEGHRYKDFLLEHEVLSGERLDPLIGIGGERDLTELELDHPEGYAGSRPVRIGNDAHDQHQLDTYGHLLDAALGYHEITGRLPEAHWRALRRVVEMAVERWRDPDLGIWEPRAEERHYTHSKLLAWVCVDRGIRLAEELDDGDAPLERWHEVREQIRADVLEHGYDEERGAFVQHYGSRALDAALLHVSLLGFLPGDDPRVAGTIDRVAEELGNGSELVHRYDVEAAPDGLPGQEGAFLMCSFDLVSALVLAGRVDEARERFERLLARAGELGLFSEEMAPDGTMLGNFPQAFTHLALIEAALNLDAQGDREALHDWAGTVVR